MNTGLSEKQLDTVRRICARHAEVEQVVLFGSRAKGTHKAGSDIDLAVRGAAITPRTIAALRTDFEESALPYFVDVVHYEHIGCAALAENIDRAGVVIV